MIIIHNEKNITDEKKSYQIRDHEQFDNILQNRYLHNGHIMQMSRSSRRVQLRTVIAQKW